MPLSLIRDKGIVTSAVPLLFRLPGTFLHGIGCHRHSLLSKKSSVCCSKGICSPICCCLAPNGSSLKAGKRGTLVLIHA